MSSNLNPVNVTCAIIEKGNDVLVVQRSETMKLPLKWEFPGGKMEAGESEIACIHREIREELCIDIELIAKLTPSVHTYPLGTVLMIPFVARQIGGELRLAEHKQYLYLPKQQLEALDWAEADIPVLREYLLWREDKRTL